jgi:protein-S-isoprenylcysteine O-methyltransferase Ste14
MFSRILIFLYSLVCYALGFAAILYSIGFVGNYLVPKTIDGGPSASSLAAMMADLSLLAIFALQHSVMARQSFKRAWTRLVPKPAERATYVLASALALGFLFWKWQPLSGTLWHVRDVIAAAILTGLYFAGWGIVFLSTFLINHFELFGLEQSFMNLRGRDAEAQRFRTPFLYRIVRHPLYLGLLLAFWSTPVMSTGHLLFAFAMTGYILIGVALEERDLVAAFGETYRSYRRAVPMVIPVPRFSGRSRKRETAA